MLGTVIAVAISWMLVKVLTGVFDPPPDAFAVQSTAPPGAGVTSLRDVVYFNGHGSSHALIVLAVYAVLGGALAMIARRLRTRAATATPAD